ncbi:MAG: 3-oxoacyl-ACP synthase [Candidatus Melainabacteria bacterium]|nr:MAG: 3-oxoacyl-ACP synthase [Candidatus Melainabacteria bacterium]
MSKNVKPLRIAGVGYCVPDTVITNDDLTKLYETSDEWIYTRTGIKERRVVSGNESAVDLGVKAAENALNKSGFKAEDIDCVIVAASAPPQLYPALACDIQTRLGIPNYVPSFDLTAACTGLIYSLQVARGLIGSGLYKNILIVAADNNSRLVDWKDRGTSILFGDGAGAMVVTEAEDGVDDIMSLDVRADGSIGQYISLNMAGENCPLVEPCDVVDSKVHMAGRDVYKFVVSTLPNYVDKAIELAGLKAEDINYLIPHQANQRIIEALQQRLQYSDEKVISNIKYYGNTSAASIPIALVEGVEKGKIKLGSTAILCGFGAGMTWGAAVVRLREGIC